MFEQELRWKPSVRAEQIGVSVKIGVVELDGHVDCYYEKCAAERAAKRVSDAKAIVRIKAELPYSAAGFWTPSISCGLPGSGSITQSQAMQLKFTYQPPTRSRLLIAI